MAKWADYCISCVNYTSDGSKISTVGVHEDNGDTIGTKATWHRQQVVDAIDDDKKTFVTIVKDSTGKTWNKGASVTTYPVGRERFIKTVSNNTAGDNLGELPSC